MVNSVTNTQLFVCRVLMNVNVVVVLISEASVEAARVSHMLPCGM